MWFKTVSPIITISESLRARESDARKVSPPERVNAGRFSPM
jgi:hypothetical protein